MDEYTKNGGGSTFFGAEGKCEPNKCGQTPLSSLTIGSKLGDMEIEKTLGLIALGWLVGAVLLMARLVRRGQALAAVLATQHPETYEALGRPRPGYLQSVQRSRFAQFVARRQYEHLGDPALSAQFEDYRRAEARLLLFLLATLGVVALLVLTVR